MHAATRNRQDNKLTILGYFFFFNDTATTEIYTLSLHDALPIYLPRSGRYGGEGRRARCRLDSGPHALRRVPGGPGRGGGRHGAGRHRSRRDEPGYGRWLARTAARRRRRGNVAGRPPALRRARGRARRAPPPSR